MMKTLKWILFLFIFLILLILIAPFAVPLHPNTDVVPVNQLSDKDSLFLDISGIQIHYKIQGEGEPNIILLHGFGASIFSWREVMAPLGQYGTVMAYDRPAFGLTERPEAGEWEEGRNPYSPEMQPEILIQLMDALEIERAVLVGNSAGGTVAVQTALQYPNRVLGLVLVDAAIYSGGSPLPEWMRPLLDTPQGQRLGLLLTRSIQTRGEQLLNLAWHAPTMITESVRDGYRKPLSVEGWDRALWELTKSSHSMSLRERLPELSLPVLVITGDDDRIVPTEESVQLAKDIPNAELVILPACGHVPQEECPKLFLEAAGTFLEQLK